MKKFGLLLITIFAMTSCGKGADYTDHKNRQYYNYYEEFGILKLDEEFYSKKENNYAVYLYGLGCRYCDNCKGAVLDYLDDLKAGKKKGLDNLYIFEREKDINFRNYFKVKPSSFEYNQDRDLYITKMLGKSSIKDTYFFGTPSLYIIRNHKLEEVYIEDSHVGLYLVRH